MTGGGAVRGRAGRSPHSPTGRLPRGPARRPSDPYRPGLAGGAGDAIVDTRAPVAQRIESRTSNPKVVGSNPTGCAFLPTTYDDSPTHQPPLAHILPTSHGQDPDLALIVGVWDRLPEAVLPASSRWSRPRRRGMGDDDPPEPRALRLARRCPATARRSEDDPDRHRPRLARRPRACRTPGEARRCPGEARPRPGEPDPGQLQACRLLAVLDDRRQSPDARPLASATAEGPSP